MFTWMYMSCQSNALMSQCTDTSIYKHSVYRHWKICCHVRTHIGVYSQYRIDDRSNCNSRKKTLMNIWSKMVCRLMHLAWGNKLNTNISFLCECVTNAKMICTLPSKCSVAHVYTFNGETHGIWRKITRNTRNSAEKISPLWFHRRVRWIACCRRYRCLWRKCVNPNGNGPFSCRFFCLSK